MNQEVLKKKIWKLEVAQCILLLMILVYVAIFSYYTIMRHYSFRTYAWDLGTLVQSIASGTSGESFANNVELYFSPTGSYFGLHFSPILFIIVPFFAMVPQVETIWVIQSIILALGSIPVYYIAKHCLNSCVAALFLSASYLLNPLLQGLNWCDFTPQVFFPLFILSATYYLKKKKPWLFLFFIVLTLMTLEQASYFIAVYAFYCAWELRADIKNLASSKRTLLSFLPFIIIALVIIWMIFSSNVKYALNPNPPEEYESLSNYELLEINSLVEIPIKALTNPELVLNAIRFDFPSKILYILLSFAPSGMLACLSPIAILPALLWFILSGLSNWPPYYQLGFQYLAFTLPFIVIATIDGVQKLVRFVNVQVAKKFLFRIPLLLFLIGLIISLFVSPLSVIHAPGDFVYFKDYGTSVPSSLNCEVTQILQMIPNDAFVLTTPTIFPHISTNLNAYVIPPVDSPSPRLFEGHLEYLKNIKYDYILFTYYWDKTESDILYTEIIKDTDSYGLFVNGPGFELYKRGYINSPQNVAIKFSYKELSLGESIVVDDSSSDSYKVIVINDSPQPDRNIWFGPYITLTPGNYTANFRLKIDHINEGIALKIDVYSRSLLSEISSSDIYCNDFSKALTWHTFSIDFSVTKRTSEVEFRGYDAGSDLTLFLDYVEVIPK
ncbi:MAG: DUF2079 domain-containing protein [Candidatus Bathyarchaeota archaeon]|nr:DUF2079 domain-containing protein [Candidatus Bathyarchaeum sp.]